MHRTARTLLLATALALVGAGAASAGTLTTDVNSYNPTPTGSSVDYRRVIYTAGAGEANAVTLSGSTATSLVVKDAGATITLTATSTPYCTLSDANHTATCVKAAAPNDEPVGAFSGDLADQGDSFVNTSRLIQPPFTALALLGSSFFTSVTGGSGNDSFTGDDDAESWDGGTGTDTAVMGAGNDRAATGDATDAGDTIDAGPGDDLASVQGTGAVATLGAGEDFAVLGKGTWTVDGGDGPDTIGFDPSSLLTMGSFAGVTVRVGPG